VKKIENTKILRKTDIVLIAGFIIFAGLFYFLFSFNPAAGDTVVIKVNGHVYQELSLNMNNEKDIEVFSDNGILLNRIRIKDNQAFMIYASCPDKRCMRRKPIDSRGFLNNIIICLPNRVTVEIIGSDKITEFDIVIGLSRDLVGDIKQQRCRARCP